MLIVWKITIEFQKFKYETGTCFFIVNLWLYKLIGGGTLKGFICIDLKSRTWTKKKLKNRQRDGMSRWFNKCMTNFSVVVVILLLLLLLNYSVNLNSFWVLSFPVRISSAMNKQENGEEEREQLK